MYIAARIQ